MAKQVTAQVSEDENSMIEESRIRLGQEQDGIPTRSEIVRQSIRLYYELENPDELLEMDD